MKILRLRQVRMPERGTRKSAGLDFFIPFDIDWLKECTGRFNIMQPIDNGDWIATLDPGGSIVIPSGIKVKVPEGKALIAFNKSGIAVNKQLTIGAQVVDEDYQGEIHLQLINNGLEMQALRRSEKVVQFILLDVDYQGVEEVHNIETLYSDISERGEGRFGHTNK